MEGESDGAAQGEQVAEVDGGEVGQEIVQSEGGVLRGDDRGCGEQKDSEKGESCADEDVPAGAAGAGFAEGRDGGEQRDKDHDKAGDEGGFGGRGQGQAGGLELIADGETEADDSA